MKRKIFNNEYSAKLFADKVNGTYKMKQLPGYMCVQLIWIVEWN